MPISILRLETTLLVEIPLMIPTSISSFTTKHIALCGRGIKYVAEQLTKVKIAIPNPRVPLKNAAMPIASASPEKTSPAM